MSKQNSERDVVLALVSGAALGTIASMLLAPEKGEVLRNRIKLRANQATKKVEHNLSKFTTEMVNSGDELGYTIGSALARAEISIEDAIGVIEKKLQKLKNQSDIDGKTTHKIPKKKNTKGVRPSKSV